MILLTGGTGFVGRHLASQFVADGRQVRVLSRTPGRIPLPEGVTWARGDLTDPASLRSALHGIETVVHAGAMLRDGSATDPALEQVNAGGTQALARLAKETGVRQFVHISSAGVYGDGCTASPHQEDDMPVPATPYERSKISAERSLAASLEDSPVCWTILRPQGLYGPDRPATAAFFHRVAQQRLWLHGPARVVVHPTHIADLAAAVCLVLGRIDLHREVINIGGQRWLEYRELISLVGERMGHVPLQIVAPRWTGTAAALAARAWGTAGSPPAPLTRFSRAWINRAVSTQKARQRLGFEPVALEWGVDQTAGKLRREGLP